MAKRTDRPPHPAKKFYVLAALLILITILFGFISVFVPWARKDVAPGARLQAYPFINCIEDITSARNAFSCEDNDYDSPDSVSGGNSRCTRFIVATIVLVFCTVIIGLLFLPLLLLLIKRIWSKPVVLALLVQLYLTIVMVCAFLQWGLWIGYAEHTCVEGSPIFPLQGYSYGWILNVFGSAAALLAWILGYLGLFKLLSWKPFIVPNPEQNDAMYPSAMYPGTVSMPPQQSAPNVSGLPVAYSLYP